MFSTLTQLLLDQAQQSVGSGGKQYRRLRATRVSHWPHLVAESSVGGHTHSTGRSQMAVGDSERHPGEGTSRKTERECFSCLHIVVTTVTSVAASL